MVAPHTSSPSAISLRRLHRFFGTTRAVDDISFDVQIGSVFGFIGPNGAGKTTAMRVLSTLDLPSYGDALVGGFSVRTDAERVRKLLGFMPDSYGVYRNVNCEEYLDFYARAYGLAGRERHRAVRRTMAFTGVDKLAEKPMTGLSKGMKQRLCLGRAMIHDPDVLVLDEPAAGLDPRARIELRTMVRELADRGKTILVSSHILSELSEIADEIGIIEKGKLLVAGPVAGIRKQLAGGHVVELRVLDAHSRLTSWLEDRSDVSDVRQVEGRFHFLHERSTESDEAKLLREILNAGFEVVEFGTKRQSLEDVFMQVTQGIVS